MHILNALGSKTALEQRGRDRGGADGFEFVAGGVAEFGHVLRPSWSSFRDAPTELGFTRVRQYHCPSRQQPTWMRRPGIHNHDRGYGFRVRAEPVIGPRFART